MADDDWALWDDAPPRKVMQPQPAESSSDEDESASKDSYFVESDADSEDSAIRRRREAETRIKDFGESAAGPAGGAAGAAGAAATGGGKGGGAAAGGGAGGAGAAPAAPVLLPGANAALGEVDGPPAFLNPEATRPLADAIHRKKVAAAAAASAAAAAAAGRQADAAAGASGRQGEWDVSRMAPKLKSEGQQQEKGVILAAPVRYKTDDRVGAVSATAIAMLGGNIRDDGGDGGDIGGGGDSDRRPGPSVGPAPPSTSGGGGGGGGGGAHARGGSTKALPLDKFMEKGLGGAALPRKRQERKDKEKAKRMKGQSAHGEWKSEAEMALRQQYD